MKEVEDINDDIKQMEKDCNLINCVAIKDTFFDIVKYFIFCKNKND